MRILSSYLTGLSQTSHKAAWVSGFYGSGKSHFLKMLCHLWADTRFRDGATARSLVPSMPDELRTLLKELDTAGRRAGGLLAAAGSLPSGTTDHVRLTVLSVLLRGVGLPGLYPQAQFCLWLHDQGGFDRVKTEVEATNKKWESELNNLYVSGPIARAILARDPAFARSEAETRNALRAQFPPRTSDITTPELLAAFRRALTLAGRGGRAPCTILILDEVQQYIGDSNDRSTLVTEVTEAISKQLESHVMVVGAGQSALTEVRLLQKLMDRFTIRVALSDADVEAVTRKVLLQKNPSAIPDVRALLDAHGGEISRQLQGTRIAERPEDREVAVDDYPLLPVRRRFWEHCFRQIDAAGTHSQLRSQLRNIHDAVGKIAGRPLGALVPGDELYEALAPEMVDTGVLMREINERIIHLSKDGTDEGRLARRICGVVFLASKLPREVAADIGIRATKEQLADLLVDDLLADNGKLRSGVERALEKLAADGVLMKVGDEFRLQTREGAEWDREFRNRQTRLANDDADLQIRREQVLYAEADRVIRSVKLLHGAAKEARQLVLSRGDAPPGPAEDHVPLWIRDGFSSSEREILDAARAAGMESPTIFAFIPRQAAGDLSRFIVEAEAAQQTIDAKGVPTTPEGAEARRGMESRRDIAAKQRDDLVKDVVSKTRVFQGGGSELLQVALDEKVRDAAMTALSRLFPRFREAVSAAWSAVIRRARVGADQPLEPVGHGGPTEQHPVCQGVLATIGAGKTGGEVRKALRVRPCGWPQDAIDGAIIALHRAQHVSATWNGAPLAGGQLDQGKISKAELRVERIALGVKDRIALRKLFLAIGLSCKPGEELSRAPEFVARLLDLAAKAGGEPPLPPPPATADVQDLSQLVGNEQLAALRGRAQDLERRIGEWRRTKDLIEARRPVWALTERLAKHAREVEGAAGKLAEVEALRAGRLLLAPTDPVAPLRSALAGALRAALIAAHGTLDAAYRAGLASLDESSVWRRLDAVDRGAILAASGLAAPVPPDVSTDEALLAELDARSLSAREADADAVQGRVQRGLEQAAKRLEPTVRTLAIERATLRSAEEVRAWIERQESLLLDAIKSGPVLVI